MAADRVDASAYNLHDLFEHNRYLIDVYQREYAWTADDVRVLITDLWEAFEAYAQRGRRSQEQVFLGPFVYVEPRHRTRYLVDGQQRFTTLHLLFLHLVRMAEERGAVRLSGKLHATVYAFFSEGMPTRYRLDIPERGAALDALRDRRAFDVQGRSLSVANLWRRGLEIRELLDERITSDNLPGFVDWLLTQVVMVAIKAPDQASGYRIFETMNDRGARLTPVDLLKSFLLRELDDGDHVEDLNQRWRDMLATLTAAGLDHDTDAPATFLKAALRAHWARTDTRARQDADDIDLALHLWVKQHRDLIGLKNGPDFLSFIEKLIKLAGHYAMFLRATRAPDEDFGLAAIYYNHANGLHNQMPLLLAAVTPDDEPSQAKPKAALAANLVDLLHVNQILRDEPTDNRSLREPIEDLIPRLRKCRDVDDVATVLADAAPSEDPFGAVPTLGKRGNNARQVKYLLARLTAFVERGCRRNPPIAEFLGGDRRWQIEHVFADHPERYAAEVADPVAFRTLRNRIGVLLLLPSSDNASYNDLPFGAKVGYYSRQNQLAAVLAPDSRQRNRPLNDFAKQHGLEKLLHDYGRSPKLTTTVQARGELYQELCRRIWSGLALGFPLPWEQLHSPPERTSPTAPRRRGGTTQLIQLIDAGVLADGAQLRATEKGSTYTATVADGHIRLPTGDTFRLPDEAAATVRGKKNVSGMSFWHAEGPSGEWTSLRDIFDDAKRKGRLKTKR